MPEIVDAIDSCRMLSNFSAASKFPERQASYSGVCLLLFCASTSAPQDKNSSISSGGVFCCLHAHCRGVSPSSSFALTFALLFNKMLKTSISPFAAA